MELKTLDGRARTVTEIVQNCEGVGPQNYLDGLGTLFGEIIIESSIISGAYQAVDEMIEILQEVREKHMDVLEQMADMFDMVWQTRRDLETL